MSNQIDRNRLANLLVRERELAHGDVAEHAEVFEQALAELRGL
jgi:hypothetical protein